MLGVGVTTSVILMVLSNKKQDCVINNADPSLSYCPSGRKLDKTQLGLGAFLGIVTFWAVSRWRFNTTPPPS